VKDGVRPGGGGSPSPQANSEANLWGVPPRKVSRGNVFEKRGFTGEAGLGGAKGKKKKKGCLERSAGGGEKRKGHKKKSAGVKPRHTETKGEISVEKFLYVLGEGGIRNFSSPGFRVSGEGVKKVGEGPGNSTMERRKREKGFTLWGGERIQTAWRFFGTICARCLYHALISLVKEKRGELNTFV